jgi:hypothetical protein
MQEKKAKSSSTESFNALTAQLLREQMAVRFRAPGRSMEPAIHDGDVLTVHPTSQSRPRPGSVLLYMSSGRPIAHRVLLRWRGAWLTRGDACRRTPERVLDEDILGVVVACEHSGRTLRMERPWTRWCGWLRLTAMTIPWAAAYVWSALRRRRTTDRSVRNTQHPTRNVQGPGSR